MIVAAGVRMWYYLWWYDIQNTHNVYVYVLFVWVFKIKKKYIHIDIEKKRIMSQHKVLTLFLKGIMSLCVITYYDFPNLGHKIFFSGKIYKKMYVKKKFPHTINSFSSHTKHSKVIFCNQSHSMVCPVT